MPIVALSDDTGDATAACCLRVAGCRAAEMRGVTRRLWGSSYAGAGVLPLGTAPMAGQGSAAHMSQLSGHTCMPPKSMSLISVWLVKSCPV